MLEPRASFAVHHGPVGLAASPPRVDELRIVARGREAGIGHEPAEDEDVDRRARRRRRREHRRRGRGDCGGDARPARPPSGHYPVATGAAGESRGVLRWAAMKSRYQ